VEVGVECWLLASIRVRRDDDLGVTLLARTTPRGVEPSSLGMGDRVEGGLATSERTETVEDGREGLGETRRRWAARRGVMGCFAFAIRGSKGLVLSVGMALLLCEPNAHDHGVLMGGQGSQGATGILRRQALQRLESDATGRARRWKRASGW
jgi:hypothetical protein